MLCFQLALEVIIFLAELLSWIDLPVYEVGDFVIFFMEQSTN